MQHNIRWFTICPPDMLKIRCIHASTKLYAAQHKMIYKCSPVEHVALCCPTTPEIEQTGKPSEQPFHLRKNIFKAESRINIDRWIAYRFLPHKQT